MKKAVQTGRNLGRRFLKGIGRGLAAARRRARNRIRRKVPTVVFVCEQGSAPKYYHVKGFNAFLERYRLSKKGSG